MNKKEWITLAIVGAVVILSAYAIGISNAGQNAGTGIGEGAASAGQGVGDAADAIGTGAGLGIFAILVAIAASL